MKTLTTLAIASAVALTLAPQAEARGFGGRGWGGYRGSGRAPERLYKFEGVQVDRWPTVAEQVATSPTAIRALQRSLKGSGYYNGPLDGRMTAEVRNAIKRLEAADGVKPTGVADERIFSALGLNVKELLDGSCWARGCGHYKNWRWMSTPPKS